MGVVVMEVYFIVLGFIAFDILTGFIKALAREGINSTRLRQGLFHKLSEILAVGGSAGLNYAVKYLNLGFDVPLVQAVSVYICVMEFVSIIENLCEMNPQLMKFFSPYLQKLKGDKDGEEKSD